VDGAGNEFLAGAGFAEDENGGIGGADSFEFLEDLLQRAAFADDLVEHGGFVDFLPKSDVLLEELFLERVDFGRKRLRGLFARGIAP